MISNKIHTTKLSTCNIHSHKTCFWKSTNSWRDKSDRSKSIYRKWCYLTNTRLLPSKCRIGQYILKIKHYVCIDMTSWCINLIYFCKSMHLNLNMFKSTYIIRRHSTLVKWLCETNNCFLTHIHRHMKCLTQN